MITIVTLTMSVASHVQRLISWRQASRLGAVRCTRKGTMKARVLAMEVVMDGMADWLSWQYGPGGHCIDTSKPFEVSVSFPVDGQGILHAMDVKLTQLARTAPCHCV